MTADMTDADYMKLLDFLIDDTAMGQCMVNGDQPSFSEQAISQLATDLPLIDHDTTAMQTGPIDEWARVDPFGDPKDTVDPETGVVLLPSYGEPVPQVVAAEEILPSAITMPDLPINAQYPLQAIPQSVVNPFAYTASSSNLSLPATSPPEQGGAGGGLQNPIAATPKKRRNDDGVKARNREAARKCRQKKADALKKANKEAAEAQQAIDALQTQVSDLRSEMDGLLQIVAQYEKQMGSNTSI